MSAPMKELLLKHVGLVKCPRCKKHVNTVTRRGICYDCVLTRTQDAQKQMMTKRGPVYKLWKKNLLRSLQR